MYLSTHYPIIPKKWGKYGANRGQTSKASHYQHVTYQITRLVTLNQQIHRILFALPWYKLLPPACF